MIACGVAPTPLQVALSADESQIVAAVRLMTPWARELLRDLAGSYAEEFPVSAVEASLCSEQGGM